jgi:hypothetical protein
MIMDKICYLDPGYEHGRYTTDKRAGLPVSDSPSGEQKLKPVRLAYSKQDETRDDRLRETGYTFGYQMKCQQSASEGNGHGHLDTLISTRSEIVQMHQIV